MSTAHIHHVVIDVAVERLRLITAESTSSRRLQLFGLTKLVPEQPFLLLGRRLASLPGVSRIGPQN